MDFVRLNIEELVEKYDSGISLRSLAKEYGTSKTTIRKKLIKAGVNIHSSSDQIHRQWTKHKEASKPTSDLTEELLRELWNKLSIETISQRTGATTQRIKKLANEMDLPEYNPPKWHRQVEWDNYQWLHKHYIKDQLSLNAIANLVNSTSETVKKKLKQHGIPIRTLQQSIVAWNAKPTTKEIRRQASKKAYIKNRHKLDEGRERHLASLPALAYKNYKWLQDEYQVKNASQIAREQDVSPSTIKYWLIKFGIYDHTKLRRWTPEMVKEASVKSRQMWKHDRERLAIRTEAQKQQISDKISAFFADPHNKARLDNWKRKLSSSAKKLWQNPKYRTKVGVSTTRGRIIDYNPIKNPDETLRFRSHLECAFAILLDLDDEIECWDYETDTLKYGDNNTYIIDFTIYTIDRKTEYVEVKPMKLQIMEEKYDLAKLQLPWRFSSASEIKLASSLFKDGHLYDRVHFINQWPNKKQTYRAWSKDNAICHPGWQTLKTTRYGAYFIHQMQKHD